MRTFIILTLLLPFVVFGQDSIKVNSKAEQVTLFLSGAQVTRSAQVALSSGTTEITFTKLSQYIDPNTVRVSGEGDFTIVSVNSRINYLDPPQNAKNDEALKSRIKILDQQIEDITAKESVLEKEKNFLLANQQIGGSEKGLTAAELKATADFFRIRYTEIVESALDLGRKKMALNDELSQIKKQVGEHNYTPIQPVGEIVVVVIAKSQVQARFKIAYLVRNASWTPMFDLRLDNISQPLDLMRRATIRQNTDEKWNDIKLTLSTGNPSESGTMPILNAWIIGNTYSGIMPDRYPAGGTQYADKMAIIERVPISGSFTGELRGQVFDAATREPIPFATITTQNGKNRVTSDLNGNFSIKVQYGDIVQVSFVGYLQANVSVDNPIINIGLQSSVQELQAVTIASYGIPATARGYKSEVPKAKTLDIETSEANENRALIEYTIAMPMSIQSDGKPYNLMIGSESIPAEYEFHAIPKLDRDAFLIAKINNWQEYELLETEAGIFYEGTFTGKTYLTAGLATDTLNVSLGRDKSIVIERKKIKDFSSSQLIGSNRTLKRTWEIVLRNNKKQFVNIVLQDQIPISREKEIVVELLDAGGAKINNENGLLTWKLKLEPGHTQKVRFSFSVKYPKEQILTIE